MRVVYESKINIQKISEDIYKKIGIQSFYITENDDSSFILNNKYKVKMTDNDVCNSDDLIYHDKKMNYAIYKYTDNNTKLEKIN